MLPRPLALPTRLALLRLAAALLVAALTLAGARASSSSDGGSTSGARTPPSFAGAQAGTGGAWRALVEGVGRAGRWLVRRQLEGVAAGEGEGGREMGRQEFVLKLVLSVVFVLLGGVFSGLSLGLMGLDSMNLQVLAASGPPRDRADAHKVLSLLSHGRHFVLVCLLLSNVIVNETLPVFLDSLTGGGGLLAVVISSAAIVIFGEVLPQALCARHGLLIGTHRTGFVRVLMYLEAPICYPTAKLLDFLLGAHTPHLYRREELKTLVELHEGAGTGEGALGKAEVELVGALLDEGRDIRAAMRLVGEVYAVGEGVRLCDVGLTQLLVRHQHFLPVRRALSATRPAPAGGEEPFVGFLRAEEICAALTRPNDLVRSLPLHTLVQVLPRTSIAECIAFLKRENPHAVLLVSNSALHGASPQGFATLEDLARAALLPSSSLTRQRSVSLGATARLSLSRPPRASASIGLGRFVQGLVDRHFTHRASSSQLSFRLSSSDEDNAGAAATGGYRALPAASPHSHHRTSSRSLSLCPSPLSRMREPGLGAGFRFPPSAPSALSVGEEAEVFELGQASEEEDEEGEGDSGFAERDEREGQGEGDPLRGLRV